MIKFTLTSDVEPKKTIYCLGLTRANIELLTSDQPIKINLSDMGGPNVEVAILFGETERSLFNRLKKDGLVPPEVEFREVVPGMSEVVAFKRK